MHEREAEQAAVGPRLSKLIGTFEVRLRKAIEHQPDKDNHREKRSCLLFRILRCHDIGSHVDLSLKAERAERSLPRPAL